MNVTIKINLELDQETGSLFFNNLEGQGDKDCAKAIIEKIHNQSTQYGCEVTGWSLPNNPHKQIDITVYDLEKPIVI